MSLVTAFDGGPSAAVDLGASLAAAFETSRSTGLGSGALGAGVLAGASGPAGAGRASSATTANSPSQKVEPVATLNVREAREMACFMAAPTGESSAVATEVGDPGERSPSRPRASRAAATGP